MVTGNDLGSRWQGLTQCRDPGKLTLMMEGDGQTNQSSQQQTAAEAKNKQVLAELLYEFKPPISQEAWPKPK